jgi:NAD+ synthase (glutamine-hydrolysing)
MLGWADKQLGLSVLNDILNIKPTAELTPLVNGEIAQNDEEEMGMTYSELSDYGKLRKISRFGPVSMFNHLLCLWPSLSPSTICSKVKRFFIFFGINRHKMTIITPSLYSDQYSCDDNRFDLRQFLYPPWEY